MNKKNHVSLVQNWFTVQQTEKDTDWVCMIDGEGPSHRQSASMLHQRTRHQLACISAPHAAGHGRPLTISCSDDHSLCQTAPHPVTTEEQDAAVLRANDYHIAGATDKYQLQLQ